MQDEKNQSNRNLSALDIPGNKISGSKSTPITNMFLVMCYKSSGSPEFPIIYSNAITNCIIPTQIFTSVECLYVHNNYYFENVGADINNYYYAAASFTFCFWILLLCL